MTVYHVSSGQVSSGIVLQSGDFVVVDAGGSAVQIIAQSGAGILNSGVTTGDIISGGQEDVFGGGVAEATSVFAGSQLVFSGGVASLTDVLSGGKEYVDGLAIGTQVESGGSQSVAGSAASSVIDGGTQIVVGMATMTNLIGDAVQTVQYVGTAIGTVLNSGAIQTAYGQASGTVVNAGGTENVSSFGSAVSTMIASGGALLVVSGGTAIDTDVASGGLLIVLPGATTSATTFQTGASAFSTGVATFEGGRLISANVASLSGGAIGGAVSGVEYVLTGGLAIGASVLSGGAQNVYSGGVVRQTTIDGGIQYVSHGAAAFDTTVVSGFQILSGQASGTVVSAGGYQTVEFGTASNTIVNIGGNFAALGGEGSDVTVRSGGTLYAGGGEISGFVMESGAVGSIAYGGSGVAGTLIGATLSDDFFTSGIVISGGSETVRGHGVASATTVLSGGLIYLSSGTTVGTVLSGGVESVGQFLPFDLGSGATAFGTQVLAGGTLTEIGHAGMSVNAVIQSLGTEIVGVEAFSSDATIMAGGIQIVASAPSIDGGYRPGSTFGTVVSAGGIQIVQGEPADGQGGYVTDTIVMSGGVQQLVGGLDENIGTNLSPGGTIDIAYLAYSPGGTATLDPGADELTISMGGLVTEEHLFGDYTSETFFLSSDGTGGTDITVDGTPCYCRGTRVLTTTGEVAVEDLCIGDHLITLSGAARPLRWIGRRAYDGRFAAANPDVWPVRFRAGSLGSGLPRRDLFVSPLHAMFLDGLLIPARVLIDGAGITQTAPADRVEYLHLELGTHDVIFAEGAAAETYLDDANRGMFHNAAEYAALYGDARPATAAYCAPRVEDGEALEAVRRRLSGAAPCAPRGFLCGYIDRVERGRIAGWARDAGEGPVRLRVSADGVPLGAFEADMLRADVAAFGGEARCGFDWTIPGGLSPDRVHSVRVQRAADGADLPGSPARLAPASAARTDTASPLRGQIDRADRDEVLGWADDADAPVGLVVLVNGQPAGRVLANRWRPDVAAAGIADGRRAFVFRFLGGLAPLDRHEVEVLRESDGAALGAPAIIDPADSFGSALEQTLARAAAALDTDADRMRACLFLREIADGLETPRLPQRARRRA